MNRTTPHRLPDAYVVDLILEGLPVPAPGTSAAGLDAAGRPAVTEYTAREGDTLQTIAEAFKVDVPTILGANPALASQPDSLPVGTTLTILPTVGVLATVAEGDTLRRIAEKYGVDAASVATFNRLPNSDKLLPGQKLVLPGARPEVHAHDHGTDTAGTTQAARQVREAGLKAAPLTGSGTVWPARGVLTTYFGEVGPTSPRGHAGIDIAAPVGTPIVAMDDGEVLKAYWDGAGYGGLVIIAHPSGLETWYAHLSDFTVAPGEQVQRGERIGSMGSTGYSTGSHLHFEVREDGALRNPMNYLP